MFYSDLPLDVHNDIYSLSGNKDLYSILTTSRATHTIASRYLHPDINNNEAIRISSERGNTEAVRSLLRDPKVDPSANYNHTIRTASSHGHRDS